jgi:hypothetical protein
MAGAGKALRGFGKAYKVKRQKLVVGGAVKGGIKLAKKVKETFKKMRDIDKSRLSKLDPKAKKKYEEQQKIYEKSKGKSWNDMKKSEIEAELESVKKQKEILYPKGDASEVYAKEKVGDTRPQSFTTYKGEKLKGDTWQERAKERERLSKKED